jgi:hypothetical protein
LLVLIHHCLCLMLFHHLLLLLLFAIPYSWCCFTISCYHCSLPFFVVVTFVCCGVSYFPSHTFVLWKYSSWNNQHLTTSNFFRKKCFFSFSFKKHFITMHFVKNFFLLFYYYYYYFHMFCFVR